jgi:hypothetical protein
VQWLPVAPRFARDIRCLSQSSGKEDKAKSDLKKGTDSKTNLTPFPRL